MKKILKACFSLYNLPNVIMLLYLIWLLYTLIFENVMYCEDGINSPVSNLGSQPLPLADSEVMRSVKYDVFSGRLSQGQ